MNLFLLRKSGGSAAAGLLLLWAVAANAATSLGDPAPGLVVERWIKGAPVRIGAGTNVFVVEFWATWCPPCRKSIPFLSGLQKKYGEKGVVIVGVSSEAVDEVVPFVTAQGDNMSYRVAVDHSRRAAGQWMAAFGETGIPHAFVVDTTGKIVWHGFPNEALDVALGQILAGKYDLGTARNLENGDRAIAQYRTAVLKAKPTEKAARFGETILAVLSLDWRIPHRLARVILTDPEVRSRDLGLALKATTKAVAMTQERSYDALQMHARALFANGKKGEAAEAQKKSIALCQNPEDMPELQKFLALYEKASQAR